MAVRAREAGEYVAGDVLGKDQSERLDAGGLAASIATLLFSLPALGMTCCLVYPASYQLTIVYCKPHLTIFVVNLTSPAFANIVQCV